MAQEIIAERYQVLSKLGSGGMGNVYRALDVLLKKEVAVKTLRTTSLNADQIRRFQTEAMALSNLKHPNIVEVMVFGLTDDNVAYLVMTFVEGKSLASLIESRGYIPAYKSVNLFIDLADGLAHAHRNGVIHRDLKPANIVINDPDALHARPIVVDFGIAQLENASSQGLTRPGALIGTPIYMSPEQLKGKTVDARSDIYSFGCVMFETLTGVRPFQSATELETMEKKFAEELPKLADARLGLDFPEALQMIVDKCLATSPDDRYQRMEELKEALTQLKQGDLKAESKPLDATLLTEKPPKDPKATRRLVMSVMVSLVVAGLAVTALYFGILGGKKGSQMTSVPKSTMSQLSLKSDKSFDPYFKEATKAKIEVGLRSNDTVRITFGSNILVNAKDDQLLDLIRKTGKKVSILTISNCEIDGTCFKKLKDQPITDVALNGTSLTDEGLKALCEIKTLRRLKLDNQYNLSKEAIAQIGNIRDLDQLMLVRCDLSDEHLFVLPPYPKLKYLDLSKNQNFTRAVLKLAKSCPQLEGINLSNDSKITVQDLAALKSLQNFRFLLLNNFNLTDDDVKKIVDMFPNLERLQIFANPNVTRASLDSLSSLKKLNVLVISGATVTNDDIAALRKKMRKCRVVFGAQKKNE